MGSIRVHRAGATVAATGLFLLVAAGCSTPSPAADGTPAPGSDRPVRGEFVRELLLTGELQAVRSIGIKAPETALFQMRIQYMAEEGTVVHAGDTVVEFDNSSLTDQVRQLETSILDAETQIVSKRAELSSASQDLEILLAEREYARDAAALEAAVDPTVLSRKDHAERQFQLSKTQQEFDEAGERIRLNRDRGAAELEVLELNRDKLRKDMLSAEADRERLTVRSPAEGLVVYERRQGTTLRYQEGDSCWPGQTVVQLPDLSEMQVEFSVNEVDAPLLREAMPVRVALDAFPGREIAGRISHIPSMAVKRDEESKIAIFRIRATLDETWVGEMKPGMSTLGRVIVERVADAPLLPRTAVRVDAGAYRTHDGTSIEPVDRNDTHYLLREEDWTRLAGSQP